MEASQALENVRVEWEREGVVTVTMSRPEKRNALSVGLMRELTGAFKAIGEDPDARVAILRGEGPAFSAGHDLRELIDRDETSYGEVFDACVELMETIPAIDVPVIAEVEKIATAAGCQLVAMCDLAVAASTATFATPGVRIGLFCTTPMVALVRAVGRKRAMEMLLTGSPIDAQTALEWGLVNRVVPVDELHERTLELAATIASASRTVVALGKAAFYRGVDLGLNAAYADASRTMTCNAVVPDAQEGMHAFLEKRSPKWEL